VLQPGKTGVLSVDAVGAVWGATRTDIGGIVSEVPATTSTETSFASPSQRFALDCASFEKLLAAAWVLQCLHDQVYSQEAEADGTLARKIETHAAIKPAPITLQARGDFIPLPTSVDNPDSKHDVAKQTSASDKIPEEMAPPRTMRSEPDLHRWPIAAVDRQRVQPKPSLGLTAKLRAAKCVRRSRLPFRLKLTLRGLRATVVATPLWLLAIIAALMLVETWRHDLPYSAQATSTRDVLQGAKRAENTALRWVTEAHDGSHMRATDSVTSRVVQELSPYEMNALRQQARYGDASAAFTLGIAFEMGRHVRQSCTEAAHWVAVAAEAGDAAAQYNLGLRYRDGDGMPVNRILAEKWLRQSSAGKNRDATAALETLAAR
jgi:Sel1 repeat